MIKSSVAISISSSYKGNHADIEAKLGDISAGISSGGYLFLLTEYSQALEPTISIESMALRLLMGPPADRNLEWKFFGNGAIRGYTSSKKNLSSTWQWVILQKDGERTLAKRHSSSEAKLKKVVLPVAHPAFTRDVANNVWHLNERYLVKTALLRFRALLIWPDELLLHLHNFQKKSEVPFLKMDLSQDLIGVAKKSMYSWENADTLF